MVLVQAFEEKEVRRLLTSGPVADLEEAFIQIDAHYRLRFGKAARDRISGLGSEDLADAWQETLRDLLRCVRRGHYKPDCEIGPWLWRIFVRRAIDQLRRKERYTKIVEGLRARLVGTTVGDQVQHIDLEHLQHLLERI